MPVKAQVRAPVTAAAVIKAEKKDMANPNKVKYIKPDQIIRNEAYIRAPAPY